MASFSWPPSRSGGAGVSSLNGLTGALTLAAGTGISITPSGSTLTIANTGSSFPLLAPNGSASAPSYSFSGQPTNGMYSTGAGNTSFSSNNTQVLSIDPTLATFTIGIIGTSGVYSGSNTATSFIPTGSSVPTHGMYLSGTNIVAFSTASTFAGSINASQLWTFGQNATTGGQHQAFGSWNQTYTQNGLTVLEVDNLSAGVAAATQVIAVVGDGTTSNRYAYFTSRNRDTAATYWHAGTQGDNNYSISTGASTPQSATKQLVVTSTGITLGTGTTQQHSLNSLLATNGVQVATLSNLPAAATAGNPNGWLSIKVNGTTAYIPFWH